MNQLKKFFSSCLTSWFWFGLIIGAIPFCAPSPLQKLSFLPINGIELLVGLLLITDTILFVETIFHRKIGSRPNPWPIFWLVLFVFISVWSTILIRPQLLTGLIHQKIWDRLSADGYAYRKLLNWFFTVIFFITSGLLLNSWEKIKKTVNIFIAATTAACLYGFFLVFSYWRGSLWLITRQQYYLVRWWQTHTSPPRFLGTAIEPQNFASLLLASLPLTLVLYLDKSVQPKTRRFWLGLAFLIQLGSLLVTFSGAGLAAGVIGLLSLIVLGWHFWDKKRLGLTGAFCFGLVSLIFISCLWLVPDFPSSITDWLGKFSPAQKYLSTIPRKKLLANPQTSSVVERHWLRQSSQKMFLAHPWIGRGVGGFAYDYRLFRAPRGLIYRRDLPRVHNQYWEILAEHGLIGAGLLFLFFGSMVSLIKKFYQNFDTEKKILALGLLAVLISFFINAWSFGIMQHLYFWLGLGLIYALGRPEKN